MHICDLSELTHLPVDKMAAIVSDDNSKCILWNAHDKIPIRISLKCVPRSQAGNRPALVQVMADPLYWHTYATLGRDELNAMYLIEDSNVDYGKLPWAIKILKRSPAMVINLYFMCSVDLPHSRL